MRRLTCLLGFCGFLSILPARAAPAPHVVHAVASFTVLADVVSHVGGAHVAVTSLVPPDGDPHEFEPAPDDARALRQADVVFMSGEGLESWFGRLAHAAGYQGRPVIVSDGIDIHTEHDGQQVETDPHVWNSVPNVIVWTSNIRDALIAADPADADDFRASAAAYAAQLHALDHDIRTAIDTIPPARRRVLTSHDAFGYFGRAYGVTFMAPQGLSTETEASAADVGKLIAQIRETGMTTYFLENATDPRLVQQVARATGAQPGGELYAEALSSASGPAPDYISMMRYNTDLMVRAMRPH
ncbi:ABC transporter substrate-binding protein [Komagataeibacter nataicola]|uniref:ABC transporter substrate-binding protein n=1 Tax=Komagataeibacter nataicola TaxID=265960 RepID=A0A9N7H157_9PROT|nr:zinc ABC transporter substrate-binding protein [Komagataeibacter nataicola]AQU87822.1 ABC transporter substrate-binding protein [Komagataeibacter nataicola]PYD66216.1 ABC transporter substrate-binding protein [Komagataeibacter nataicola]WEQ55545.1 zinc ABC transporter substrate-binding protein [Komagataeibacter nataicola]WNM09585.1 zinc ABC transporter substrate-binding protein [Komagataeibacter nataicola]GBR25262.1 Mn2+/Zn2+ ABC transporter substrate-binding periplasmic protein [Komagataei